MRFRRSASAVRHSTLAAVVLAIAFLGGLDGCSKLKKQRAKYSFGAAPKVLNVKMADLQPAIAANIQGADRPAWVTQARWDEVRKLYARFGNAPLWLEEGGVNDRAKALITALRTAPDHALDTSAYPISQIEELLNTKLLKDSASANSIAAADVMLTSAYVAYAADMLAGQVDPKSVSQAWHISTPRAELDSALVRSLEDSDMTYSLGQMAPQDQDYAALKAAYARYRDIAAKGGWPQVPAGVAGAARDAALHARLDAEIAADSIGNVPGADTSSVSYAPLPADSPATATSAAVPHTTAAGLSAELMKFQERHGLERTGKLDKATIDALNVPVEERVRQIGANLERHRWLPRTLGSRYVYVNVPAYRLDAYDSGQRTLTMRVVVGAEYEGKTTPVFSDSMETVVFRPYWNITPDIQAKEVGPKAASDPGYLERNNMEYYKDGGATRIRQKPGDKNSLGLVKFLFPNDFNIYLHDTPAKELFQKTDRAASHGCIRLEKPAELAQWVLGWDAAQVQAQMHGEDNHAVKIPHKIPVYIVYFTAYLRDGRLFFGDDIYNRDNALVNKLSDQTVTKKEQLASMKNATPARAPAAATKQ